MPIAVSSNGRFPWTRRAALEFWSRAIAILSLLATGAIALGAAFRGLSGTLPYTLVGLGLVLALPMLWITLARIAERRYLTRPSKGFLAAALGLDVGGTALVAAAVVLLQPEASQAASVFTAGGVLEGCGTVLLVLWFVAACVIAPTGDHMHSL
jgi:membrane protease YdiL (CAAX protease family)